MASLDKTATVTSRIEAVLKEYQVIEISFPVGAEPANPIRLGEAIASGMQKDLKLQYAENVSVDGKNDDMTYAVSTMMEMRRFLTAYASQVSLTADGGARLTRGDVRKATQYSKDDFEQENFLLARMCGLLPEDLDQMDVADSKVLLDFFRQSVAGEEPETAGGQRG